MAMTISEQNYINEAINRARGAYNTAVETSRRNAERMGVNPNSGKFSAMEQSAQFATAASAATAGNEASTGWLKTAQAQANEDEAMRYKYAALDLSRDEQEHKEWMDKEGIKMQVEAAKGYLDEQRKTLGETQSSSSNKRREAYEDKYYNSDRMGNMYNWEIMDRGASRLRNQDDDELAKKEKYLYHNEVMKKAGRADLVFNNYSDYEKWYDKQKKSKGSK